MKTKLNRIGRARADGAATPRTPAPLGRRSVVEGQVVDLLPDGRARIKTTEGHTIDCRCAHAIDLGWLRAAVAIGPVDAEATVGGRGGSLWAVFPGPEHAEATSERVVVKATKSIELTCGQSTVTLKEDGRVRVRGRDVTARGSKVARLQGNTVRLN